MAESAAQRFTPASFPHAWKTIVCHAQASVLLALRATCTQLRDNVNEVLLYHIVVLGSTPRGGVRGVFERGYVLSHARGGFMIRVRVPAAISIQASTMKKHCRVVDLEGFHSPPALRYISRLVTPKVIRIMPGFMLPTEPGADISLGAKTMVIFPLLVMLPHSFSSPKLVSGVNSRRVVLHQHIERSRLIQLQPMRPLKEVVLIFIRARKPEERYLSQDYDPSDLRERPETTIKWYLGKLIPKLSPNVSVTIVGLERVCEDPNHVQEHIKTEFPSRSPRIEFRKRSKHKATLTKERWGLEMEGLVKPQQVPPPGSPISRYLL